MVWLRPVAAGHVNNLQPQVVQMFEGFRGHWIGRAAGAAARRLRS